MTKLKYDIEHGFHMSICRCGARFEGAGPQAEVAAQAASAHVCLPRDESEVRTYWLSFCDGAKPEGQRFLGVCIVDVTRAEADDALLMIALGCPMAQAGAEWIGAASRKAHREGCNPGGEVLTLDITGIEPPVPLLKNRLLSYAELEALGLKPGRVGS